MRALLWEVHQTEEMGIIHVTHDFNEALQLGTRVLVMNQGKILQQGETSTVFNQPRSLFVADFLQRENIVKGIIEKVHGVFWFRNKENNWMLGPIDKDLLPPSISNQVCLVLHAGQIEVSSREDLSRKTINSWEAYVEKATVNSTHVDLACTGHGRWHVALSRNEWQRLALKAGSEVTLSVEISHIHLIGDA